MAEPAGTGGSGISAGRKVAVAGVIAGVTGLAVQLIAANSLTPEANARFLIFWSLLFGVYGVLTGLQTESTRAVRATLTSASGGAPGASGAASRAPASPTTPGRHPRVLPVGLGIGMLTSVLLAATSPWWSSGILADAADGAGVPYSVDPGAVATTVAAVAAVCLGALAFAGHATTAGALSGLDRWGPYSALIGGESTLRLVITAGVALAGASLVGYELAAALATFFWAALYVAHPASRAAWSARADRPLRPYLLTLAQAMGATTATAVLVTGYAVMIDLTTPARIVDASAPFLLAVSLTRATLLMPVNAFQGMAIAHVVTRRGAARRFTARAGAAVVAVGAAGALAAWAVGPWLLNLLRPGYHVTGPVLAGLMVGATSLAVLVIASSVCLALGRHGAYVLGWVLALLGAVALLLTPWSLETRVIASLTLGPLLGTAFHAAVVLRETGAATDTRG